MKKNSILRTCLILLSLTGLTVPSPAQSVEELLRSADEVLQQIVELRGLELTEPVSKGIKNREEIRSYLLERIAEEYPPEELEIERKVLVLLGVIPADLNLHDFMIDLLTEQIAGFYDPKTSTFYIADWIPVDSQRPIMAHELTHALQDQHFDLSRFLERVEGNDDEGLARSAVIEGEGIAVMLDYMLRPMGQSFTAIPDLTTLNRALMNEGSADFKLFSEAPLYLRESLVFPYTYGARFLQMFRRQHSWEEVSRIYSDLPTSTEQILHPEKYLDERDLPTTVQSRLPERLTGWRELYSNVLGEFSTLLLLQQFLDEESARRGSEGWDGDRVQLFEGPAGQLGLTLQSVWDSESEAREFFQTYSRLIARKYPEAAGEEDGNRLSRRSSRSEVTLILEGDRVEILEVRLEPDRTGSAGSYDQPAGRGPAFDSGEAERVR